MPDQPQGFQQPYQLIYCDDTTCSKCGQHPDLLCPIGNMTLTLPAFYICACGRVAQVAVGPIERAQEEGPVGGHRE